MIEEARRLNPDITFRPGNMLALDLRDASLAGIAAFYAVVNLPKASLPQVFREMARVLQSGGLLLLSFHIGDETIHRNEWWDRPIAMDFHFLQPPAVKCELEAAGLVIEEIIEREPYAPEVEHQSRRAYIFARKPAAAAV
jgi:ubiquinone/menaquinone biosynthesis C-methylase UbiE